MSTLARRLIVLASLAGGVCFGHQSAPAGDGPAGAWFLKTDQGTTTTVSKVEIFDRDAALTGNIVSSLGRRELTNITFADGLLEFDSHIGHGGTQRVRISFSGTIDGDRLEGTWSSGVSTASAIGMRSKTPPHPNIVGMWELITTSVIGKNTRQLIINTDLTGTYGGGEFEAFPITNLRVDGQVATMEVTLKHAGVKLPSTIRLTIDGDELKGVLDYGDGEATIVGRRAMISIAGKWNITAESPLGKNARQLVIYPDMTGTYGGGSLGTFEISHFKLDGDQATMNIALELQELVLPSTMRLTFDGDRVSGTLDFGSGEASITGYRK